MKDKTKTVELAGERWELRRMTPAVGSYIWQRLMAANVKAQSVNATTQPVVADAAENERLEKALAEITPEQKLRTVCAIACMYMTYEDLQFMQTAAMRVTSVMQSTGGTPLPMPVMQDDGRGLLAMLEESPALVTQLMTEVLVFNLASFLQPTAGNSPKAATAV